MAKWTAGNTSAGDIGNASEWVGGLVIAPTYVVGEGEPYRPEILVWLDTAGLIQGMSVDSADELLEGAGDSLHQAIYQPAAGPVDAPARVRVADESLAAALLAGNSPVDVVCAPTPEIDEVADHLFEYFSEDPAEHEGFVVGDIMPEVVGRFFQASAALYRCAPWDIVPHDESVFMLDIEALDLHGAVLSVIGQMGESYGVLMFDDAEAYEAFRVAGEQVQFDQDSWPDFPRHLAINYERGAELPDAVRREVDTYGWEVAGPHAYPWPVILEATDDLVARAPSQSEFEIAEAICRVLSEALTRHRQAVETAWTEGTEWLERFELPIGEQALAARLAITSTMDGEELHDSAAVEALRRMMGGAPGSADELHDRLLDGFAVSPEGAKVSDPYLCRPVLDFAGGYFSQTIATLEADELEEIVFDIIPRKVSIQPGDARHVILALRGLYRFLKRGYALVQADACLQMLGGKAISELRAALADPGNFGFAKSLLMDAEAQGFDTRSQAGLDAWMAHTQGKLPPNIDLPGLPGVPDRTPPGSGPNKAGAAAKKKKKKRKQAKASRKRNR